MQSFRLLVRLQQIVCYFLIGWCKWNQDGPIHFTARVKRQRVGSQIGPVFCSELSDSFLCSEDFLSNSGFASLVFWYSILADVYQLLSLSPINNVCRLIA